MNPIGNLVQKAFYLGVGLVAAGTEKAGATLGELRQQATKLAEELVARGEMTTEEAKRFVDDLVQQAQSKTSVQAAPDAKRRSGPQEIEIDFAEGETNSAQDEVAAMEAKIAALKEELRRLQS
ncbi:MAG: phasin family protein [Pseudanabaenaceae cyanobacterium]